MKETIEIHVEEMDKMKEECCGLERSATIDRKVNFLK
jgi:chaperonin cofactor prefoldin